MFNHLYTPWGETIGENPWQTYPRPQLKRESYVNLNGLWEFTVTEDKRLPKTYDKQILVPFCPESILSGIGEHFPEGSGLWYRKKFTLPEDFNKGKILLHVGAADQVAKVYVNRILVGEHTGGYDNFTFDITSFLE